MPVSRRQLLTSLALTGGCTAAADAQEPAAGLDGMRSVAAAHGANLSDDRLRVVKRILEQRKAQLQSVRDFEIDDSVAPTQGIR